MSKDDHARGQRPNRVVGAGAARSEETGRKKGEESRGEPHPTVCWWVGEWRIVYRVDDGRLVVMLVWVGVRGVLVGWVEPTFGGGAVGCTRIALAGSIRSSMGWWRGPRIGRIRRFIARLRQGDLGRVRDFTHLCGGKWYVAGRGALHGKWCVKSRTLRLPTGNAPIGERCPELHLLHDTQ